MVTYIKDKVRDYIFNNFVNIFSTVGTNLGAVIACNSYELMFIRSYIINLVQPKFYRFSEYTWITAVINRWNKFCGLNFSLKTIGFKISIFFFRSFLLLKDPGSFWCHNYLKVSPITIESHICSLRRYYISSEVNCYCLSTDYDWRSIQRQEFLENIYSSLFCQKKWVILFLRYYSPSVFGTV